MSTTAASQHPPPSMVVPPPPSSMPRRNSLRLPMQPPDVPVPPSLVGSPYLRSGRYPQQQRGPAQPSEEDELWLQDTVPIGTPSPSMPSPPSLPPSSPRQRQRSPTPQPAGHPSPMTSPRAAHNTLPSERDCTSKSSGNGTHSRRGSMQIVEAGLLATATFDFGLPASLSPGSRQAWRRTAAGYTARTSPSYSGPMSIAVVGGGGPGGMLSPPSHYFSDMNSVR